MPSRQDQRARSTGFQINNDGGTFHVKSGRDTNQVGHDQITVDDRSKHLANTTSVPDFFNKLHDLRSELAVLDQEHGLNSRELDLARIELANAIAERNAEHPRKSVVVDFLKKAKSCLSSVKEASALVVEVGKALDVAHQLL
jgi:hypothetical protein